jgi:hypothetical protein
MMNGRKLKNWRWIGRQLNNPTMQLRRGAPRAQLLAAAVGKVRKDAVIAVEDQSVCRLER